MLCQMVGIEADLVVALDETKAIAIMLAEFESAAVEMIENSEINFHDISLSIEAARPPSCRGNRPARRFGLGRTGTLAVVPFFDWLFAPATIMTSGPLIGKRNDWRVQACDLRRVGDQRCGLLRANHDGAESRREPRGPIHLQAMIDGRRMQEDRRQPLRAVPADIERLQLSHATLILPLPGSTSHALAGQVPGVRLHICIHKYCQCKYISSTVGGLIRHSMHHAS